MKKYQKMYLLMLCSCCLFFLCSISSSAAVAKLEVKGTQIINVKTKKAVQLKGVSTHGLSWFPQYVNKKSFQSLKNMGCNTVRLAMYTAEYNGYCVSGKDNQKKLKKLVENGVSYAVSLDMYVIIDWHILSDGNPKTYEKQSLAFFKEMAKKYKNCPNVIFEICNEPNGGTSWSTIKDYAQKVLNTIRKEGSNAIVIVGTPTWSQDVDAVIKNRIKNDKNVMYAFHFYAATHGSWLRDKLTKAVKAGIPIFVSEFGICEASGNGRIDEKEANKWMSYIKKNKIPYVMWNLSNKNEKSALIKASCKKTSGWSKKELSASGQWLLKTLK